MRKGIIRSAILAASTLPLLPQMALAQVTIRSELGSTFGLGTADLEQTVISIVQWALGLLALVAVVIIIWGGFTWITAGGNEEKIEKAKKLITAAVVGLIVVLLAWAIVIFVVGVTTNTTA